jgi:hypothetical protein
MSCSAQRTGHQPQHSSTFGVASINAITRGDQPVAGLAEAAYQTADNIAVELSGIKRDISSIQNGQHQMRSELHTLNDHLSSLATQDQLLAVQDQLHQILLCLQQQSTQLPSSPSTPPPMPAAPMSPAPSPQQASSSISPIMSPILFASIPKDDISDDALELVDAKIAAEAGLVINPAAAEDKSTHVYAHGILQELKSELKNHIKLWKVSQSALMLYITNNKL